MIAAPPRAAPDATRSPRAIPVRTKRLRHRERAQPSPDERTRPCDPRQVDLIGNRLQSGGATSQATPACTAIAASHARGPKKALLYIEASQASELVDPVGGPRRAGARS